MTDYEVLKDSFLKNPTTLSEFADREKISVPTASRVLKKYNIAPVRSKSYLQATDKTKYYIVVGFNSLGYSERYLSEHLNVSRNFVRRVLTENDIKPRSRSTINQLEGIKHRLHINTYKNNVLRDMDIVVGYFSLGLGVHEISRLLIMTENEVFSVLKSSVLGFTARSDKDQDELNCIAKEIKENGSMING